MTKLTTQGFNGFRVHQKLPHGEEKQPPKTPLNVLKRPLKLPEMERVKDEEQAA